MEPLIFQLPKIKNNTFNINHNIVTSKFPNKGQLDLGYLSFYEENYDKLEILDNPQYKNKDFYKVVNPFEINSKNDQNIFTLAKNYFKQDITKNFLQLWEILITIEPINTNKNINIYIENDDDKSFEKCILKFREKFYKTKDKISKTTDNDIIIINAQNQTSIMKLQEPLYYYHFLNNIILILKYQKKGGNLILKIFNTVTDLSIKLLHILQQFYDNVIIYKPFTSDPISNDRYIIGINFNLNHKIIKEFEKILNEFPDNKFVIDIFPNLNIPTELKIYMKYINSKIMNQQYNTINKLIVYINSGNYFGDSYHNYLDKQNEATTFWNNNFLTDKINKNLAVKYIENNKKNMENFYNQIIS